MFIFFCKRVQSCSTDISLIWGTCLLVHLLCWQFWRTIISSSKYLVFFRKDNYVVLPPCRLLCWTWITDLHSETIWLWHYSLRGTSKQIIFQPNHSLSVTKLNCNMNKSHGNRWVTYEDTLINLGDVCLKKPPSIWHIPLALLTCKTQ